jgi:thiol-disulfide isomerase/thioredoxin
MSTSKILALVALILAIGSVGAGFIRSTNMPQQTTVTEILDHTSRSGGQSELASLQRADEWLNSPPLTPSALRGKVVLVDFWTYTCINWIRTAPYVRAWAEKYKDQGLVVIGVHAPEFAFEKSIDNVRRAVKEMRIDYPVAVDNEHKIWRAFDNSYWPALYFIKGVFGIITLVKANMNSRKNSFRNCWPKQAPPVSTATPYRSKPAVSRPRLIGGACSPVKTMWGMNAPRISRRPGG